jgi:hypothetical protein
MAKLAELRLKMIVSSHESVSYPLLVGLLRCNGDPEREEMFFKANYVNRPAAKERLRQAAEVFHLAKARIAELPEPDPSQLNAIGVNPDPHNRDDDDDDDWGGDDDPWDDDDE